MAASLFLDNRDYIKMALNCECTKTASKVLGQFVKERKKRKVREKMD